MEHQQESHIDKRTAAILEISKRHIEALEILSKTYTGLELEIKVMNEVCRFGVEMRAFISLKFRNGGVVPGKCGPMMLNAGEREFLHFESLTKFIR